MDIKPDKRPYKFRIASKEKLDLILKDISNGCTNRHAALSNGISERHFYEMIKQGVCDLESGYESLYSYLAQSLAEIEKKEISLCRKQILNDEKGHKGAEWTLEHAYWRYFGSNAANIEMNERLEKLESKRNGDSSNEGEKELDSGSDKT